MLMLNKNTKSESGAVAMITVIFFAIVATVLVAGLVRLVVNEQRLSTDDDLTARAFFAAESGIEDGKRALSKYIKGEISETQLNSSDCESADIGTNNELLTDESFATEYSCQVIDLDLDEFQAQMAPWETIDIPLRAKAGDFDTVEIQWHVFGDDDNSDGDYSRKTNRALQTKEAWNSAPNNFPSMLKTHFYAAPKSGTFTASDTENYVGFPIPRNTGSSSVTLSQIKGSSSAPYRPLDTPCIDPSGATAGEYVCKISITGFSNSKDYGLKLSNLYRSSHIQIKLLKGGNPVVMTDAQAIIESTGQAGDIFRRIEARVSLSNDKSIVLPDYAIITAGDICKRFVITDDVSEFAPANGGIKFCN